MVFGSLGGSAIITTVLGIATHVMDFGMGLGDAIAAPRLSQRNGDTTTIETDLEATDLAEALAAKGHTFSTTDEIGAATGIQISPDGTMQAAAEPNRRGGGGAMVVAEDGGP